MQLGCAAVLPGCCAGGPIAGKVLTVSFSPSCLTVAGSAISSIDPVATLAVLADMDVPPLLYNLVFGESVLNE